jgi:hypothetical protein
LLTIGCVLAVGVVWILLRGRLTNAGYIIVAILTASTAGILIFWHALQRDVAPYSLSAAELCRYDVREGQITNFGRWTSFGSSRSRYERIVWKLAGPQQATGRTPYVRAILSAFLDLEDIVYIGIDRRGLNPPIFLGAKKPAPEVLVRQPPASVKDVYAAFHKFMKTSQRWKKTQVVVPFGADEPE